MSKPRPTKPWTSKSGFSGESHHSCSDIIHSFDSLPVVMAVCNVKSGWPFHAFITVQQLW